MTNYYQKYQKYQQRYYQLGGAEFDGILSELNHICGNFRG